MIEESKLPKGWEVKKLGEVCLTTSGGTPNRGNKKFYEGTIPWVKSGELDRGLILETEERISEEAIKNSSAKIFPKGTLLIALYGATIGKLAFLGIDAASNQAVCGIFKSEKINSNYLFNFLFYKKPTLVKQSIGGAQPNISQGILKNLEIPIPPIDEQQKIVTKIEELFSQLENGKQQLLTAQKQLKTYRQSLLKSAFEGKLTNPNLKAGELPKGWEVKKLGEVGEIVSGGTPSTKIPEYWDGKISWITPADLSGYQNKIIFHGKKSITEAGLKSSSTRLIRKGSVLFSSRAPIGYVVMAGNELCTNQGFKSIVPNEFILSEYLFYYLKSSKQKAEKVASGTTFKEISLKAFSQLEILIPPLLEQQKIVAILESKLTICDKIEETIKTSLQQSETLRQSILKKAFEGRLV